MEKIEQIRTVMANLIENIVDEPSEAEVTVTKGQQTVVYEINVKQQDRGKVIGKNGDMAKSLRHILTSLSAKNNMRAILEICD